MQIKLNGEGDLEQALLEIHRRACAYEGPLMREFKELAQLSAPLEPDEPLMSEGADVASNIESRDLVRRKEIKSRFEDALSLLMLLAFPVNGSTEKEVRKELSEVLAEQEIESIKMRVGARKVNLRRNLARRPTQRQLDLRNALLRFLPEKTEVDL
ncbi:hypothetical protein QMA71_18425 [Pseudomonas otitidis]|uniref:hypothetical protein n=1 Tax=Metapseudomonas otitidis TaxID=319939 RepID=UPI0024AD7928|nr:hypothetical protein [Pseudomonas otitidis]MDI6527516.1 hypothetical protein [Pseudomonas otitidis]